MGDISDAIINGLFCETCGAIIDGDEPGYSRQCPACENEMDDEDEP